ncbi:hypothetical protein ACIGO9_31395 [Nocardia asteroides]|uniref:hypothetical protein n=1 Tax=Nocardia asteroides TaxID=1824 RepID=UPI0037C521D5
MTIEDQLGAVTVRARRGTITTRPRPGIHPGDLTATTVFVVGRNGNACAGTEAAASARNDAPGVPDVHSAPLDTFQPPASEPSALNR